MGTASDRTKFEALIETCRAKRYEEIPEQWDKLLALLGIPLRAQPLVSRVIVEGRYAKAADPQAYLAIAARNQAKRANLLKDSGDNRGATELEAGPISKLGWVVKQKRAGGGPRAIQASSHDEFIELANFHLGEEEIEERKAIGLVPRWLLIGGETARLLEELGLPELVDWFTVATHAVKKPDMAEIVGFVLTRRCHSGQSRANLMNSTDMPYSPDQLQAAWKWVDRNWESAIVPLFRMDKPPRESPIKKREAIYIPPSAALKSSIERQRLTDRPRHLD